MMRAVAEVTRPDNIRTVVSLNSIMVDGTGMCGGCRVLIGNTSKFACVDGPEFDAHDVDFQILMQRNAMYRDQEKLAMDRYRACGDPSPGASRHPLPASGARGDGGVALLPACGEKVAEGRMRGDDNA
jgi:hypothetical protein